MRPTLLLMIFLASSGILLHYWGKAQVNWPGFLAMLFFYSLIFFFGAYAASLKKSSSVESMVLADRSVPLWIGMFTMSATWMGGGYINGTAEYTASSGLVWVQAPWCYALSLFVGGLFFARKMRKFGFYTLLDPLEQRYGKKMTALLFLPALSGEIFWTGAILMALGTTFGTILGMDTGPSIVLSAVVAIAYTALGGLWAVALTDVLQLILMMVGLAVVVPYALEAGGGWSASWAHYQEHFGAAAGFLPSREALTGSYWMWWDNAWMLILGGVPWQVYFQRVLSARDSKTAVRLSYFAGIICLIGAIPSILVGISSLSINWTDLGLSAAPDAASILPAAIRYATPGWVATIGLGAIAAAVMSSVDSSILSASTMASWNVVRPLFRPNMSSNQLEKVIKKSVWIIGIAALLLALQVKSVYLLWFLCSDLVYCLLFAPLVLALFDPKTNRIGALAGFVVAALLRIGAGEPAFGLPAILPFPVTDADQVAIPFRTLAMGSGFIINMIVSRMSQNWYAPQPLKPILS